MKKLLTDHADLPGRGYSSSPSPNRYPQSSTFFGVIILSILASSPLAWTGPSRFSIVGYSLGGGIAVNFVSYFANLISSVILLAPSGLIRSHHFSWQNRLLYSENLVVPESILEQVVRWKLRHSDSSSQDQSGRTIETELPIAEKVNTESHTDHTFDVAGAVVSQSPP